MSLHGRLLTPHAPTTRASARRAAAPVLLSLALAAALGSACDDGGSFKQGGGASNGPITEGEDIADWSTSPVETFGQLHVDGVALRGEHDELVQLRGISSMWLNWEDDGYAESKKGLQWMRDNWHVSVIRAAMGVEPNGAYLTDPETAEAQVATIVNNAKDLGMYVIIDWHDHHAIDHQAQAEAFFAKMAKQYGGLPNVLYETFNEPLQVNWSAQVKPYHEAVVAKIRAEDPDNVAILGTPNWSQDVDVAAGDRLDGTNLMYTLHFYACSHGASVRAKGQNAILRGLPLFVTEWGATNADGGTTGSLCPEATDPWIDFMNQNAVSWTAWKLDDCKDLSCYFKDGAPVDGPFDDEWLQGHGPYVRDKLLGK